MRSYQGIFLCFGMMVQASQASAVVLEEDPTTTPTGTANPNGAPKAAPKPKNTTTSANPNNPAPKAPAAGTANGNLTQNKAVPVAPISNNNPNANKNAAQPVGNGSGNKGAALTAPNPNGNSNGNINRNGQAAPNGNQNNNGVQPNTGTQNPNATPGVNGNTTNGTNPNGTGNTPNNQSGNLNLNGNSNATGTPATNPVPNANGTINSNGSANPNGPTNTNNIPNPNGTPNPNGAVNPNGTGPQPGPNINGKNGKGKPGAKGKLRKKASEVGEAASKKRGQTNTDAAVVGEAQTLPKSVIRVRYVLQSATADKSYDAQGKEFKAGATLSVLGHALVAEYGITDKLTFQLIMPYTSRNILAIDANQFRKTQVYEDQFKKLVDGVAPALIAKGICADTASCRAAIDAGLALGVATPLELPTGEKATVGANVPIRLAMDSIILKAIEPTDGKTGLGDVQVGVGYNIYSSPLNVLTLGFGFRLPTGEFSDVPAAERAPGAGFLNAGFIIKYDLHLNPVMISLSNQAEYSLNKAKQSRSSVLDPRVLNTADPATDDPAVPGAGDGVSNDGVIEHKGISNVGYVRAAIGLGTITKVLKPVAVYGFAGWLIDPEYVNQGQVFAAQQERYTVSYAVSIDGLALDTKIPVALNYQHDKTIAGKNAFLAPDSDIFQVSLYYKF